MYEPHEFTLSFEKTIEDQCDQSPKDYQYPKEKLTKTILGEGRQKFLTEQSLFFGTSKL